MIDGVSSETPCERVELVSSVSVLWVVSRKKKGDVWFVVMWRVAERCGSAGVGCMGGVGKRCGGERSRTGQEGVWACLLTRLATSAFIMEHGSLYHIMKETHVKSARRILNII